MSKHKKFRHRDKSNNEHLTTERNYDLKLIEKKEVNISKECDIKSTCDFKGIMPAKIDKPYPSIQVENKNEYYADLLSRDFCGEVSEFTAIAQYVNHELRFSLKYCEIAKTLLSISRTEMTHFEMIGKLITLLGGTVSYTASTPFGLTIWCGDFVDLGYDFAAMIQADIDGEIQAIEQYRSHIEKIDDPCINAILRRIIEDEEYHIELLNNLIKEL